MDYYIMKMLLFLLSIVDAVVVPIIPYESDSIRVFCITDESSDVSFPPDKKCESSCGYYDGQNTCCKVWVVTEDTVVRCYQSGQRPITLDFTVVILPIRAKQTITNKTQSELICLNEVGKDRLSHSSQSTLYMKYALLYGGKARQYDSFFDLGLIKLPADESEVRCNNTRFAFHISPDSRLSKIYERIDILMILMIMSIIVGVIFCLFYTYGEKLATNLLRFYK